MSFSGLFRYPNSLENGKIRLGSPFLSRSKISSKVTPPFLRVVWSELIKFSLCLRATRSVQSTLSGRLRTIRVTFPSASVLSSISASLFDNLASARRYINALSSLIACTSLGLIIPLSKAIWICSLAPAVTLVSFFVKPPSRTDRRLKPIAVATALITAPVIPPPPAAGINPLRSSTSFPENLPSITFNAIVPRTPSWKASVTKPIAASLPILTLPAFVVSNLRKASIPSFAGFLPRSFRTLNGLMASANPGIPLTTAPLVACSAVIVPSSTYGWSLCLPSLAERRNPVAAIVPPTTIAPPPVTAAPAPTNRNAPALPNIPGSASHQKLP